jgi:ribosomal protein S17E
MVNYQEYLSDRNFEENKQKIDEDMARIRHVLRA